MHIHYLENLRFSNFPFPRGKTTGNKQVQRRVAEILEVQGLGLKVIIKQLKTYLKKNKCTKSDGTVKYFYARCPLRLEAIRILLRLHGLLGNQIPFSPEQMVKEFEALNQKRQDGAG